MLKKAIVAVMGVSFVACRVDRPLQNTDTRPEVIQASVLSPTSFAPGQLVRITTTAPVRDQPKASSPSVGTEAAGATGFVVKRGIVDSIGDGATYFLLAQLPSTLFGGWVSEAYLEAAGPPPPPPSGCCYAAPPPLGAAGNSGTYSSPWLLQHALNAGVVPPGKDLWLRGGVYVDLYTAWLSGSPTDFVVIKPAPYERVVFRTPLTGDVSQLKVEGQYLAFWDLEFENTNTNRGVVRPRGVYNKNSNNMYVRLIIRDVGTGIYNEPTAKNVDIVGCVIFNQGYQLPDRGHGHGMYIKSNNGPVRIRQNI